MRTLQLTVAGIVLAATLVIGQWRVGPVPPLGDLLHPLRGVWAVAGGARLPDEAAARIPGLEGPVRVLYDDRGVPHIFASTPWDAARALGYVVARDRLFQLEVQTRATAGTLTELVGPEALPLDRGQRRLGLAWAAERSFAALDPASTTARLLEAYAQGVNAWVDGIGAGGLPLEYHLLGARPARWQPVHTLYLLKRMGYTLTYSTPELRRERIEALIGPEAADELFPVHSPIREPLVPAGARAPAPRDTVRAVASAAGWSRGWADARDEFAVSRGGEAVAGSNNWAAAPSRTEAGFALLAGDPHLELTLPSIWYEVHLAVPGELDVYGVTIPGVPGVVIGFNRRVAWSFTNTEADVMDFYTEALDDPERPTAYALDGAWRPLERRIEEYRGRRGELLATDTIYHTHRGPLLRGRGRPYSLRWTVLEETGEIEGMYRASMAGSVTEWLQAMERFRAPPQNALVADWTGSIAIRSNGRFPLRPGDGRGNQVRDGSRSASDWVGDLPVERWPAAVDPSQGFLASANQEPVDPAAENPYFGAGWPAPWRAVRINQLLRADSAVTPEDMRRFQTDPGSARADRFVPAFLAAAEESLTRVEGEDALREAVQLLAQWDRRYTRENERAILFELAMEELERRTWDELALPAVEAEVEPGRLGTPGSAVLAQLLEQPRASWWDARATADVVEDRDAILNASLVAALERARGAYGPPDGGGWRWDRVSRADIHHLLRLPSLSALGLPVQGGPGTLNPSTGPEPFGASWRMVVELRPEIRAWTIYPGGQSGNPVSPWYRDRIGKWVAGELDPVLFPHQPSELDVGRVAGVLLLHPEGAR
jgi:penicillin amidase